MSVTDIIAIFSLINSVVAVGISWYSASESIRKHRLTMNQKCDLVVRPRGLFREMPPAKLMAEIQQINFMPWIPQNEKDTINKHWQDESLIFIMDDIEDGDVYYGIIVKDGFDPLAVRNEILPMQYFDKVYVTKQGNKKHKKMGKGQR